ncbi:PREDICTED: uncharacterized protein K02A2.6-like [Rhagoletis zephyria]|uniref:uncharacterized protein K02A2.6-like n=1 Tax=Rhagoletis zephyria TaxID=28612 RepID=UPI0008113269|nr:PREDICTED: uncharacterized protein K02A2.6-like [Rhagoletis zephyria]
MDHSQFKALFEELQVQNQQILKQHQEEKNLMQQHMKQQQNLIERILQGQPAQIADQAVLAQDSTAFKVKCLADSMVNFEYDPDKNQTFEAYYERYESVFTNQAECLDEPTKVYLLFQKFNQEQYQRYADSILPLKPQDCTFANTVTTLKKLFGYKETKFAMRHRCFNLAKLDHEDFSMYAAHVKDSLILEKLLTKVDNQDIELERVTDAAARAEVHKLNLQDLINEAERIICLKLDKGKVGEAFAAQEVHSVQQNKNSKSLVNKDKSMVRNQRNDTPRLACFRCGEMHWSDNCPCKDKQCGECNEKGHKTGFCAFMKNFKGYKSSSKKNHSSNLVEANVHAISNRKYISPVVNGTVIKLQVDTASDITIISKSNWILIGQPMLSSEIRTNATSASGAAIPILGAFNCGIKLNGKEKRGICYVTSLELNLFGIPWITSFDLWSVPFDSVCKHIKSTGDDLAIEVCEKFPQLFSEGLGCFNKGKVSLKLKPGAHPIFRNARPVPQAAREPISIELERLQHLGIISPIKYSQWAAPIVVVKKKNGKLRICADYSTGLNNALEPNMYPLPTPDIIFAKFAGKTIFSTIDLSDVFFQVEVDDDSKEIMAINTHVGMFKVNRLQQGVKTAPGEFQAIVDKMLSGTSTFGFIDDMITAGENLDDHKQQLFKTLEQLQIYGFKLNISKCCFGKSSVNFCGHIIDEKGIRPNPEKIWEVQSVPQPKHVSQLRSFLGSVNYYGKFIKSMKQLRGPLDDLLKKEAKFEWQSIHKEAFDQLKKILSSDLVLTHFDPRKDIVLATDASKDGMGAALMYRFKDGSLHPIMRFAATFNEAEKNYSQIEKEARAFIFGLKRSHIYIAGRRFFAQVDHKPLLAIFGSKSGIPVYTANRLQRWALIVLAYDINFEFIGTNSFGYVDVVSRLMSEYTKPDEDTVIASISWSNENVEDISCFAIQSAKQLPITFKDIQVATNDCPTLKKVIEFVSQDKWPKFCKQVKEIEVAAFFPYRYDLKEAQGCLFRGEQIIIPFKLRKKIIGSLHEGHPGVCRIKLLAADKVFWPRMSKDIEQIVKSCDSCAKAAKTPIKCTLHPWPMPIAPWIRVHLDYAGPIDNYYFLIIVDAFSKWPEIIKTKVTTSEKTVDMFDDVIAHQGLCEICVTDNGPQFVSCTFEDYCKFKGIKHLTTSFYSPQSNGQAERFVELFKKGIGKAAGNIDQKLREFLFSYRYTPSYHLGMKSPFELMTGRPMRTKLDLLKPKNLSNSISSTKMEDQFNYHHGAKWREFNVDDEVYYQLHSTSKVWEWVPGIIKSRNGAVNYTVDVITPSGNRIVKAHANQLKRRYSKNEMLEWFKLPDFEDNLSLKAAA